MAIIPVTFRSSTTTVSYRAASAVVANYSDRPSQDLLEVKFNGERVAQKPLDDLLVFHRAAPVLDHEELAAEFLDEGERLNERFGAGIG